MGAAIPCPAGPRGVAATPTGNSAFCTRVLAAPDQAMLIAVCPA